MSFLKSWKECYLVMPVGLMLFGCATIRSGTTQQVIFDTSPQGADVSVEGKVIGKTPLTAILERKDNLSAYFYKEGFAPASIRLETHLNSWTLLGGPFGSTTDDGTGADIEYSPGQYLITLIPAGASRVEAAASLSERQKAIEYIVVNCSKIIDDAGHGGGEYLDALVRLLQINPPDIAEAAKKILKLADANKYARDFAFQLIAFYPPRTQPLTSAGFQKSPPKPQAPLKGRKAELDGGI